ncbi:MAG: Fe/S biogenesis protein NfuA [Phycisphaerae bacterium]|nr:Fe/S biogenesis protein NfuA [Phycisphaerae bacterium]
MGLYSHQSVMPQRGRDARFEPRDLTMWPFGQRRRVISAAEESPERRALRGQVEAVIDEFRPFIRADGGEIELVDVDERGVVRVRMKGACVGCPASFMTLNLGIERRIRERVPGISAVVSV